MKKLYAFGGFLTLVALLVMSPMTLKQTSENLATTSSISISIEENTVEARSRSRSRSAPRKRSKPKSTFKRKKPSTSGSGSSTTKKKTWKPGGTLFKKGDSKGKAKALKARPKTTTKPGSTAKRPTTTRKPGSTAKRPKTTRKPMTAAKRGTRLKTQRASLSSPRARTARMSRQRTRGRTMYQSRSHMRSMRSDRNYWRSRSLYDRNVYYGSRRYGGWGYGYHPGLTYHRGWGTYGYGYTRGGFSIVDVMIINSLFGHSQTSRGDTVVNNYYIDGEKSDVVVVPKGSYIDEVDGQQVIMMPDGKGGSESSVIPEGSTITDTKKGTLVQTPDGQGVLIPEDDDAYKAEKGYKVPETAQQAQTYAAPPSELK